MAKFAVLGLGKFGMTVATTLYQHGAEVLAIDNNQSLIDEAQTFVTHAYRVDCTDEIGLKQLHLHEMDAVILAIGQNIEVSILTSAILKKIGVGFIHAKADSKLHGKILEIIGVQNVVFPEEQIGMQLANSLLSRNVERYLDLSTGHSIVELITPRKYVGKSLQELALPSERNINVIAIKSERLIVSDDGQNTIEKKVNDLPGANDMIHDGDTLVLLGPKNRINELILETSR